MEKMGTGQVERRRWHIRRQCKETMNRLLFCWVNVTRTVSLLNHSLGAKRLSKREKVGALKDIKKKKLGKSPGIIPSLVVVLT